MRQASAPPGVAQIVLHGKNGPSPWKKEWRNFAISMMWTKRKTSARRRNWNKERILAGVLVRREALDTVNDTVVGDGRRDRRRTGICGDWEPSRNPKS